ncbi:MAG: hypothetical protein LBR33_05535 [Propionibacteriaceae bacterium]|jgi:hypothetical protein|nr:hypothetical protein [Propionibacteriaceae bacterium]
MSHWLADVGWRLGQAAAVAATALGLAAVGLALIVAGPDDGVATALGAAVTLVFFALGHTAQVLAARLDPRTILGVALTTYALQVLVATLLIRGLSARGFAAAWLFLGVLAGVLGWVAGLVLAFRRARIPIFDPPAETPPEQGMTNAVSPDRLIGDERSEGQ